MYLLFRRFRQTLGYIYTYIHTYITSRVNTYCRSAALAQSGNLIRLACRWCRAYERSTTNSIWYNYYTVSNQTNQVTSRATNYWFESSCPFLLHLTSPLSLPHVCLLLLPFSGIDRASWLVLLKRKGCWPFMLPVFLIPIFFGNLCMPWSSPVITRGRGRIYIDAG